MIWNERFEPIMIVLCIFLSNIGTGYIIYDMQEKHQRIFGHPGMRYLYVFCMVYLGSGDPRLSAVGALIYALTLA
jgi:hypothetical protein